MGEKSKKTTIMSGIITFLGDLPWPQLLFDAYQFLKQHFENFYHPGMYEVLEYQSTLEMHDAQGKRAAFRKQEKVRFLQDNIIAYQDQAWGDGKILQVYRCTPGKRADQYRLGYKTLILISLREVKKRGDEEQFNIHWEIEDGFLRSTEQWETQVSHRTKSLQVNVIFPEERPPLRCLVMERNRHRSRRLQEDERLQLPDGRWKISWKVDHPRKGENYILQWDW